MPESRQLRRALRRAIPRPVRQRLYDWSPSRRRRWRQTPGLRTVPPGAGAVLSFDDGPDPGCTPDVLDALRAAGAKATFFVLGVHARESPELIRRMIAEGHEVALHGMTHRRHDALPAAEMRRELADGAAAIEGVVGERPRWYRPPFGSSSPALAELCRELGMDLAYWSAWGQDWEDSTPARIAALVERDLEPGAIVLLHDSARYGQRDVADATVEALPPIAAAARGRGLELKTLSAAADGEG
jgi:peptidoglycan/xylan/chitin deacetylase (PgdA/CDA1 family)